MKYLVAVLSLLFTVNAHAGFNYRSAEGLAVVGYDEPCGVDIDPFILLALKSQGVKIEALQRADVVVQGEAFSACWLPLEPGKVFMVDERGGFGFVEIGKGA
jgi:hypothetical protein